MSNALTTLSEVRPPDSSTEPDVSSSLHPIPVVGALSLNSTSITYEDHSSPVIPRSVDDKPNTNTFFANMCTNIVDSVLSYYNRCFECKIYTVNSLEQNPSSTDERLESTDERLESADDLPELHRPSFCEALASCLLSSLVRNPLDIPAPFNLRESSIGYSHHSIRPDIQGIAESVVPSEMCLYRTSPFLQKCILVGYLFLLENI